MQLQKYDVETVQSDPMMNLGGRRFPCCKRFQCHLTSKSQRSVKTHLSAVFGLLVRLDKALGRQLGEAWQQKQLARSGGHLLEEVGDIAEGGLDVAAKTRGGQVRRGRLNTLTEDDTSGLYVSWNTMLT